MNMWLRYVLVIKLEKINEFVNEICFSYLAVKILNRINAIVLYDFVQYHFSILYLVAGEDRAPTCLRSACIWRLQVPQQNPESPL